MRTLLQGRRNMALAFNRAVREGRLSGPVVLSRDHHDVSGTDSPYRETTNVRDGSKFCAGKRAACVAFVAAPMPPHIAFMCGVVQTWPSRT